MLKYFTFAAVGLSTLILPMAAQAGELTQREIHQERRIAQGVKSGELNPQELRNLQRREASIAAQRFRFAHNGNGLQPWERRIVNQRLDNVSHSIYKDKHD